MEQYGIGYPNLHLSDKHFEMGVLDAVAHFNIGNMATLIYDKMGMERGYGYGYGYVGRVLYVERLLE